MFSVVVFIVRIICFVLMSKSIYDTFKSQDINSKINTALSAIIMCICLTV